ncbi:hypothetical protein COX67_01360, partial [Candidatus Falkowbacteria bacterium CG_4_10_14_0_2_um_filter_36_22]
FPLWWYSTGLMRLLNNLRNFLSDREKSLALLIWIKNIGRPMYGQYDWQGRIISFFMRLIQIIIRSFFMLFWLALALAILGLWALLPFIVLYNIYWQLFY